MRNQMNRSLLRTFTIALASMVAIATAARADDLVVGFSQIGAESAWRTAETKSMKDEAKKRGITLKFSDAQQKQENQIKAIRSFIAQQVNAIVLAPVVETGWEPVLKEAKAANIPVILADRTITVDDPSLYVTFVGTDLVAEGRMAGEWLAKDTGGKANIAEQQGTTGRERAVGVGGRRQRCVVDLQEFRSILRRRAICGDNDGHRGRSDGQRHRQRRARR